MSVQCYTWILHLFHHLLGDCDGCVDFINCIPDDVLKDIFSRLPAQSVLQCRKVCRRWRLLTLSTDFIEFHLSKASPGVALYNFNMMKEVKFTVVNETSEKEYDVKGLEELLLDRVQNCCNGLLLFRTSHPHSYRYVVLNPLAKGRVTTIDCYGWGTAFGFYFHPSEKRYMILFVRRGIGGSTPLYEYNIYQLETKTWRTAAVHYFPWTPSCYNSCTTIVNGALHWLVGHDNLSLSPIVGIMVFELDSERLSMRSLPQKEYSTDSINKVRLLVKEEHLCLCRGVSQELKLEIWILDDYTSWSWTLQYCVNLDWNLHEYPIDSRQLLVVEYINVLSIDRNEVKLDWIGRGLFSYHLRFHSVKEISKGKARKRLVVPYTESPAVLHG